MGLSFALRVGSRFPMNILAQAVAIVVSIAVLSLNLGLYLFIKDTYIVLENCAYKVSPYPYCQIKKKSNHTCFMSQSLLG